MTNGVPMVRTRPPRSSLPNRRDTMKIASTRTLAMTAVTRNWMKSWLAVTVGAGPFLDVDELPEREPVQGEPEKPEHQDGEPRVEDRVAGHSPKGQRGLE